MWFRRPIYSIQLNWTFQQMWLSNFRCVLLATTKVYRRGAAGGFQTVNEVMSLTVSLSLLRLRLGGSSFNSGKGISNQMHDDTNNYATSVIVAASVRRLSHSSSISNNHLVAQASWKVSFKTPKSISKNVGLEHGTGAFGYNNAPPDGGQEYTLPTEVPLWQGFHSFLLLVLSNKT